MNDLFKYEIACGSEKAMQMIAENCYKGLNPKTHKCQVVDKEAKYIVRIDKTFLNEEGELIKCATLLSDKDLLKIKESKGLI